MTLADLPPEIIWAIVERLEYRCDAVSLGLGYRWLAEVVFCRGAGPAPRKWARKKLAALGGPPATVVDAAPGVPLTLPRVKYIVRVNREFHVRNSGTVQDAWSRRMWMKHWAALTPEAAAWLIDKRYRPWGGFDKPDCRTASQTVEIADSNPGVWRVFRRRFNFYPHALRHPVGGSDLTCFCGRERLGGGRRFESAGLLSGGPRRAERLRAERALRKHPKVQRQSSRAHTPTRTRW